MLSTVDCIWFLLQNSCMMGHNWWFKHREDTGTYVTCLFIFFFIKTGYFVNCMLSTEDSILFQWQYSWMMDHNCWFKHKFEMWASITEKYEMILGEQLFLPLDSNIFMLL